MTPGTVLAIRVGRAGDMAMITPALRAILEKHPDAEVHLLTSPDGQHVLRAFDPRLTRVLTYERRGLGHAWRRMRLQRELAAAGYAAVYCFETKSSYRTLLERIPGQKHFLAQTRDVIPFPERCLRLVEADFRVPRWLSLPVADAARAAARAMLAAAGIDDSHYVIGLHPSFSALQKLALLSRNARRRKIWPVAAFARLADSLTEYGARAGLRLRIVCDLLPEERALGEALVAASGGRVTLFTERPDFERYKAVLARMDLLVTPDTGPMHIAAAVGTPLVALFSGRDPRDCGPYTAPERYAVLRAEETQQPALGVAGIPVQAVFEACSRFLPVGLASASSRAP